MSTLLQVGVSSKSVGGRAAALRLESLHSGVFLQILHSGVFLLSNQKSVRVPAAALRACEYFQFKSIRLM